MIRLDNVSLYFPDNPGRVLTDISWRIGDNDKWILFGPNGSGKTKLLEIITGYRYPSGGSIARFVGASAVSDIRELWKRIGYVSTPLRDMFNARERIVDVVVSGAHGTVGLYREPGPEEMERAFSLLGTIGLDGRCGDPFGVLSDGERQKVLMLRAVINRPELLILDEPTMALDLPAREDLLASLETICAGRKIAVIHVTHHTEEITGFFRDIFMLKRGRRHYSGGIREGLTPAMLSGVFDRTVTVVNVGGRYYTMPA